MAAPGQESRSEGVASESARGSVSSDRQTIHAPRLAASIRVIPQGESSGSSRPRHWPCRMRYPDAERKRSRSLQFPHPVPAFLLLKGTEASYCRMNPLRAESGSAEQTGRASVRLRRGIAFKVSAMRPGGIFSPAPSNAARPQQDLRRSFARHRLEMIPDGPARSSAAAGRRRMCLPRPGFRSGSSRHGRRRSPC